jgi:hypothetical protein
MLDEFITFRVYVYVLGDLIATLTIFGFIFAQCIKGRFIRESYPLLIAGFVPCMALSIGEIVFFFM